jgi:L-iditol 2-dehydrogenase
MMKALRYYGPSKVAVEEVPSPLISEGEVLVSMKSCGICGTDVKTYVRGHPLIPPGSVLGHEIAGVVTATEHPNFKIGDRVVVGPYAPCMDCMMCRRGHFSLCENLFQASLDPGGFAEMIRVPRRIADQVLFKIPDGLDFDVAALTEPLACCVHGLEALDFQRNQSLVIIGDGPMGLMQAALGKALGASPVVLCGMTPNRLEFAARVADHIIDSSKQNVEAILRDLLPVGPEKILVSVASVDLVQQALMLVGKGGAVNIFAGMPKDATFAMPVNRIHYDEVRVVGTFGFGPQHFRQALDLLVGNTLPLQGFITRKVDLDGVEAALQAAQRYDEIKVVAHA